MYFLARRAGVGPTFWPRHSARPPNPTPARCPQDAPGRVADLIWQRRPLRPHESTKRGQARMSRITAQDRSNGEPIRARGRDHTRVGLSTCPACLVRRGEGVYLTRHGRRVAAIVSTQLAAEIEQAGEEADIAAARAALDEGGEQIPWEQVKAELGLARCPTAWWCCRQRGGVWCGRRRDAGGRTDRAALSPYLGRWRCRAPRSSRG